MPARERGWLELALEVWSRRKWWVLLSFCAVMISVASLTIALPDLYRATATVAVERLQPEPGSSPTGDLEMRLHTLSQEVLSRPHLLALIDRFDLYPGMRRELASGEVLARRMRKDVTFELKEVQQPWGRLATVGFALSYRGMDPETVAAVTNALSMLFVEGDETLRQGQNARAVSSLEVQLEEVKKELEIQERRIAAFKQLHIGELPEQMELNLSTLGRMNAQLSLANDAVARAKERRATLLRQLDATEPRQSRVDPVEDRILSLRQELAALRQSYTDKYPNVARLKAEIAELERRREASGGTPNESATSAEDEGDSTESALAAEELRRVDAEIESLADEQQKLKEALRDYQSRVENAPGREQELQALARDYATTKALYESLLKRYEEAQLSGAAGGASSTERFRILEAAMVPREPVAPNRLRLLLTGLVLALAAAAGIAVLAEQSDTSFHSVDDLRAFTRVPVLATIPQLPCKSDTMRRRRRFGLVAAAALLGMALLAGAAYRMGADNDQIVSLLSRGGS